MATVAPYHIDINPWLGWNSMTFGGSNVRPNRTTSLGMAYMGFRANSVTGCYVTWDVPMAAGTWTITYIGLKDNNAGIITPSLDGVDLSTLDMYSGSNVENFVNQWTGISVATTGIKTLKLRTDSKNASSGNYNIDTIWITLTRTGA